MHYMWKRPHLYVFALNVDGSALTNSAMAGFGGIICDRTGCAVTFEIISYIFEKDGNDKAEKHLQEMIA